MEQLDRQLTPASSYGHESTGRFERRKRLKIGLYPKGLSKHQQHTAYIYCKSDSLEPTFKELGPLQLAWNAEGSKVSDGRPTAAVSMLSLLGNVDWDEDTIKRVVGTGLIGETDLTTIGPTNLKPPFLQQLTNAIKQVYCEGEAWQPTTGKKRPRKSEDSGKTASEPKRRQDAKATKSSMPHQNAHTYITPENVIKRWKEGRIDDIDDPNTMQTLQSALESEVRIKFSTLDIKRIHIHTKGSGSHNPFDTGFMKTILRLRDKSERDAEGNSGIYNDEATQRIHEQHEEELASEGRESWMELEGSIKRSSFDETAGMPAMTEGEANLTPADLTVTPPNASDRRPIEFSAGIRLVHEVSQAAQPTTVIPSTNREDELIDATRSMSPDGRSYILNAQIGVRNAITDAATTDKENPGSAASNDSNEPQPLQRQNTPEPSVLKLGLPMSSEPHSEPSHRRHQDELLPVQTPSKGLRSETRIETKSHSGTAGSSGSATSALSALKIRFRSWG